MKKANPLTQRRIELLGFLQKLNTSIETKLIIGRMLENKIDEHAKALASLLHEKIIDCKNEAEVIERLFME